MIPTFMTNLRIKQEKWPNADHLKCTKMTAVVNIIYQFLFPILPECIADIVRVPKVFASSQKQNKPTKAFAFKVISSDFLKPFLLAQFRSVMKGIS